MHHPAIRLAILTLVVTTLVGCYGGGGVGSTPLPAEIFDGLRKGNQVARVLIRQQAQELSMGQPTLDRAGTLGGFGHLSVDVRGTTSQRRLAEVHGTPITNAPESRGPLATQQAGGRMVALNLALGLAPGFVIGNTRVFGIDLLGGVALTSNASVGPVDVKRETGSVSHQYGLRIGVLEETDKLPGIAVSYTKAEGPARRFDWSETVGGETGGSSITMSGTEDSRLWGWRLTTGKHLGRLGVSAGMGRDEYDGHAGVNAVYSNRSSYNDLMTRGSIWNWYGGLSYRAGPVALVGELRHMRDNEAVHPSNDVAGLGNISRTMLTIGVAFSR